MYLLISYLLKALYELVKCNFNAEESLRRIRYNVKVFSGKEFSNTLISYLEACTEIQKGVV